MLVIICVCSSVFLCVCLFVSEFRRILIAFICGMNDTSEAERIVGGRKQTQEVLMRERKVEGTGC